MGTTCKFCGYVFDDNNLEESIETHLQEKHYLGYQDYYEISTLGTPYVGCWKCGSPRYFVSPYLPGVYLPCSCCLTPGNKQSIQEIRGDLCSKIKDYQGKILRSRYYQYILSELPSSSSRFLPKDLEIQSSNLLALKRMTGSRLDKSSIFRVVNTLGRSSEISGRNLDALKMDVSEFRVIESSPGVWEMGDTGLYIKLPEIIPFDPKHHSRGSILNQAAKRTTRKLRFSDTGECIKFWNVPNLSVRTILCLVDKDDSPVSYLDLSEGLRWKLRFGILKTKPILSRVFEIYNELLKYVVYLEDSVFLLNSIEIPVGQGELRFGLTWSWEDLPWGPAEENYIKLSIL